MGDRTILHSDMNCFYASVEMLHHPELEGKPLAVGGDPEARHGIVLTANYIAKKCGVKTGMALWQAKQACPEIIFVPPRMDLYLRFSSMAREIYSEYTDKIEPYGIDEGWLDVTESSIINRVGALVCCLLSLLSSMLAHTMIYSPWVIYFSILATQWLVRFIKMKRRSDLLLTIMFFILSVLAFVGFVRQILEVSI